MNEKKRAKKEKKRRNTQNQMKMKTMKRLEESWPKAQDERENLSCGLLAEGNKGRKGIVQQGLY